MTMEGTQRCADPAVMAEADVTRGMCAGEDDVPRGSMQPIRLVDSSAWYTMVRIAMLLACMVATATEIRYATSGGITKPTWVLVLFVNAWGWLDAVLRYPVLHEVKSFFVFKQALLGIGKVIWAIHLLVTAKRSNSSLLAVFLLNCIGPVLYFLLLPLDATPKEQQSAAAGACQADILLLCLAFLKHPQERRLFCKRLRARMDAYSSAFAAVSPRAEKALSGVLGRQYLRRCIAKRCV
eukprot:TRINITY_DN83483_c0_g1_i1.p1 TRINITY_DN83483_c0_g1~~TRINITY_DN83483_c0_g1_i1.p1  ORF type:complete len:238 (-),score=20.95 TRINITY_DN83483_c0_g1_i1:33-746(-)